MFTIIRVRVRHQLLSNSPIPKHSCDIMDPTTQPLEPILFPKLRICFADFPYLHYSMRLEALNLGDLMRL